MVNSTLVYKVGQRSTFSIHIARGGEGGFWARSASWKFGVRMSKEATLKKG